MGRMERTTDSKNQILNTHLIESIVLNTFSMYKELSVPEMEKWSRYGSMERLDRNPDQPALHRHQSHQSLHTLHNPDPAANYQVNASDFTVPMNTDTVRGQDKEPVAGEKGGTGSGSGSGSGSSQPTAMEEDPSTRADLGAAQFQSATARRLRGRIEATSIVTDSTFFSTVTADPVKVGSMNPPGDTDVLRTFRGARMQRAGENVNQYKLFAELD